MALVNEDELFLTGAAGGGLSLQPEEAENGMSRWTLREAYGGWNILCIGTDMPGSTPWALEFYSGHITTYAVSSSGIYVFNFYENGKTVRIGISLSDHLRYAGKLPPAGQTPEKP